jgi:anti-sigma factor RsiW
MGNEKSGLDLRGNGRIALGEATMVKGCKAYAVELSAYFDGELEGRALQDIEAHLTGCDACRNTLDRLTRLRVALHAMTRPHRRHGSILEDLRARLAQEEGADAAASDKPLVC